MVSRVVSMHARCVARWPLTLVITSVLAVPLVALAAAPPPSPIPTPIGCADVCDGRFCEGRCPDGTIRGGSCQRSTLNGCQCEPFECPGPCGITVDAVPVTLTTPSVTLTGNGSFAGYSQVPVFISGGAQEVGFTFVPGHPFSVDVPLKPGLNQLKFDALATGPPGCHSEFDFNIFVTVGTPTPSPTPTPVSSCIGDCNGDGSVDITELILGVNIALGNAPGTACPSLDESNCPLFLGCFPLMIAVNNALNGCSVQPTPTPKPQCSSVPCGGSCTISPPCTPGSTPVCPTYVLLGECELNPFNGCQCQPLQVLTPTPTPTPTSAIGLCLLPQASPTPPALWIPIQDVSCGPVPSSIEVHLAAGDSQVSDILMDIIFDAQSPIASRADGKPDCTFEPDVEQPTSVAFRPFGCQGSECTAVRALITGTGIRFPLPDGLLFTCNISVSADTSAVLAYRFSHVILSDPSGQLVVDAGDHDGAICFYDCPPPTPTPPPVLSDTSAVNVGTQPVRISPGWKLNRPVH
jgi:hypothetical protein